MLLDEKVRHHRARFLIIIAWISGGTIGKKLTKIL